jgi:probable rRNA maturation factor
VIEREPSLSVAVVKAVRAPLTPRRLRQVLGEAFTQPRVAERARQLAGEAAAACELTVRITGDRELHRLNREFLGEDHPTDVLSFPGGSPEQDGYLGDVALSWPAVLRQAESFGHAPDVEASLLCVHGLLHVLGWDHADPEEEREMTELTLACLGRAGVHPSGGRLSPAATS